MTRGGCHESKTKIKQNLSTCNSIKTGDGDLVCHLGLLISCFFFCSFTLSAVLQVPKVIYESGSSGCYFFLQCVIQAINCNKVQNKNFQRFPRLQNMST